MRVALKVVLATVLGTLTVLILFGYLRIRREIALFDSDIRNDHRLIGATLAVCVGTTWRTAGPERALDLVAQADADRDYLTIGWVYPAGADDGDGLAGHFPLGLHGDVEQRVVQVADGGGQSFLVSHVPVREQGRLIGAVEISESLSVRDEYLEATIESTALATASMVFVSGVVALVFGIWIVGRPLASLADKANRIGRGDLSRPLRVVQRDEIGELAREMNAMCERLVEANTKTEREASAKIAAVEQLRHADRLITVGTLAAGIAHELGTPLNVIAGRVKMLRRNSQPEADEYLRIVAEQAERMTSIIRQLMDFARRREPKVVPTDLRACASSIQRLVSPIAAKKQVEVALLPGEPILALADAAQIEQVLSNLVVNAVHACSEGGRVEIECAITAIDGASSAVIRVRDDGYGMDARTLERAFEPFFTTKEVGQGTGLGLSVAHGIVQEHGGTIKVESQPGRGSTFSVYLPRAAT